MSHIVKVIACAAAVSGLLAGAGGVQSGQAATGSLVAAYGFNEGTGSVLRDSSGNHNDGTVASASWTTGRYGGALSFNGSSSMVTIPGTASVSPTSAVTVEAWVNPSTTSGWRAVAVKEQTSGALSYGLYGSSDVGPASLVYTASEQHASDASQIPVNTWTHVAAVYDGSVNRVYVNGSLLGQSAGPGTIAESGGALRLGGDTIWSEWFKGTIDELRIYSRALTGAEIQTDMTTPVPSSTGADTQAPTTPTSFRATGSTRTSVSLAWTASTDNVGVSGYDVYQGTSGAGSASSPSFTVSGLSCGTSYTFSADAVDAAGNRSGRATVSALTLACADTQPPTVPGSLTSTSVTMTSVSLAWSASSDNVGVSGYGVYKGGSLVGSTASTVFTATGLSCGTSYSISVDAVDGAGNRSGRVAVTASTSACSPADTQAPSTPAGLAAGATTQTSIAVSWTASSDNIGVVGYTVYDGAASVGTGSSTSSTVTGLACGSSYTLGVDAYDAAGNHSAKATLTAGTSACPSGGPATANLWVGPSGGSCSRSASPAAYNAATACGAVASAWSAAQGGDAILIVGSSTGQLYTSGFSASGAKPSTVTISLPSGQSAWFAGDGSLTNVTNMLVTDDQPVDLATRTGVARGLTMGATNISGSSANITFNNVDLWCQESSPWHMVNGSSGSKCSARLRISGVNGFEMDGGSIGPITDCITACTGATDINKVSGCPSNPACQNITFRHVWFHDNRRLDSNVHSEMWKLDQGHNITIDGSLFTNCTGCSSAVIMFGQNGSSPTVDSFTLENSVLPAGSGSPSVRWGYCSGNCAPHATFLYNTFEGSVSICTTSDGGCAGMSHTNFVYRGNTAWNQAYAGCLAGATYDHNTWYTDTTNTNVARCSGDNPGGAGLNLTSVYASPDAPNYDYHMSNTAPATYAGAGGTACAGLTDMYGRPRPLNGTCDVGAVER